MKRESREPEMYSWSPLLRCFVHVWWDLFSGFLSFWTSGVQFHEHLVEFDLWIDVLHAEMEWKLVVSEQDQNQKQTPRNLHFHQQLPDSWKGSVLSVLFFFLKKNLTCILGNVNFTLEFIWYCYYLKRNIVRYNWLFTFYFFTEQHIRVSDHTLLKHQFFACYLPPASSHHCIFDSIHK